MKKDLSVDLSSSRHIILEIQQQYNEFSNRKKRENRKKGKNARRKKIDNVSTKDYPFPHIHCATISHDKLKKREVNSTKILKVPIVSNDKL